MNDTVSALLTLGLGAISLTAGIMAYVLLRPRWGEVKAFLIAALSAVTVMIGGMFAIINTETILRWRLGG